jgi:hypothetical protein
MEDKGNRGKREKLDSLLSIQRFKQDLVTAIPYVPNNKESKLFLLSLGVDMLIHMHEFWRHRLIEPQARTFDIPCRIRASICYIKNRSKVARLMAASKNGEDINGYLSSKAHNGALDVEKYREDRDFMRSRDRMLVCEGFHHFHLEPYPQRTNEVVIAKVTPKHVDVIGIFPHDVFEESCPDSVRKAYEKAVDEYAYKYSNGGLFIGGPGGGMQNLAGSSAFTTQFHTHTYKIIALIEEHQGGLETYVRTLFKEIHAREPKNVNPRWVLNGSKLEIFDKENKVNFTSDQIYGQTAYGRIRPMH